jgi:predicted nucleotidyltransferase
MTYLERSHIDRARKRLRDRALARTEQWEKLRHRAVLDVRAILDMMIKKYAPIRIYQWGSVLRVGGFKDYSDIDLAVEGIIGAQIFFSLLGDAQALTRFPLDLVQIEKIAPEYAEDIRQQGKLVYEQCRSGS